MKIWLQIVTVREKIHLFCLNHFSLRCNKKLSIYGSTIAEPWLVNQPLHQWLNLGWSISRYINGWALAGQSAVTSRLSLGWSISRCITAEPWLVNQPLHQRLSLGWSISRYIIGWALVELNIKHKQIIPVENFLPFSIWLPTVQSCP